MTSREPPAPPRPELARTPREPFGWLEARLLHDGSLARLGPDATAVLTLLALAADRRGASFYSRARMAERLGLARPALDAALTRLLANGLVAHRPWRDAHLDGVWQLLPPRLPNTSPRRGQPLPLHALLTCLGIPRTHTP
jgi:hypothetical protein